MDQRGHGQSSLSPLLPGFSLSLNRVRGHQKKQNPAFEIFLLSILLSWVAALNYFLSVISALVRVNYLLICVSILPAPWRRPTTLPHGPCLVGGKVSLMVRGRGGRSSFCPAPSFFLGPCSFDLVFFLYFRYFFYLTVSLTLTPCLFWEPHWSWKHPSLSKWQKINEQGACTRGSGKRRNGCILFLVCILLSRRSVPLPLLGSRPRTYSSCYCEKEYSSLSYGNE